MPRETETKVRIETNKVSNPQARIRRAVKKHNQHRKAGERRRVTRTRS